MPRLAIQINYSDANPNFFSWLVEAIPPRLTALNLDSTVYLAQGPTPRPVDVFDNLSLFHYAQAMIDNSSIRQQVELNGDWFVHVLITTEHEDRLLGLMYDFAFDPRYRQGCAVFAGEIRRSVTGAVQSDFQRVVLRTVLHEIGHCLNFIHHSDLRIMDQTGDLAQRLGSSWISRINYQYSQQDLEYITNYPSSCRPGGSSSNVGGIVQDKFESLSNKVSISVKPFTDKNSNEFELGGTASFLIKITNKTNRKIRLISPLSKNSENYKLWLKAPRKKERLIKRTIQGCGIKSEKIEIEKKSFKYFPLHLFADDRGYLFNNTGKYKITIAIKQDTKSWVKSRCVSFTIKNPKKAKAILKETVNSPEVLKYMLLGAVRNRVIKAKVKKVIEANPLSEFSRAVHWNKLYEIKKEIRHIQDKTTKEKLNKKIVRLYPALLKSETSGVRKGKVVEEYQKASLAVNKRNMQLQPDQIKNINEYKKFKTHLIKRENEK